MNSTLRVVVISHGYFPRIGGAERMLMNLNPLLKEKGIDIHVLTRRLPNTAPFEYIDGIPVYRLPSPGSKPVASLVFTLKALALIKRLNPDLIHAHELISPATTALLAKWLFGYPFIITLHRSGSIGDVKRLKSRFFGKTRLRSIYKHIETFIVISRQTDKELADDGVPEEKRAFIPNGVDIDRFAPLEFEEKIALRSQLGFPPDGKIVVFAGRLSPEKRVANLIKFWPAVRDVFPDTLLLILGTGPEETELRKLAGDGVLFLGGQNDVVRYFQMSDLFVLPSIAEGMSVAVLEAMSCGLPVVITSVGGAQDIIHHKETGWLIAPDNSDELINGILKLLSDDGIRTSIGQKACKHVRLNYSIKTTAGRLSDIYLNLLSKG